jgi:GNAT superfamily N-acetyltransferase
MDARSTMANPSALPSGMMIREATFNDLAGIIHVFAGDDTGGKGDAWTDDSRAGYETAMQKVLASDANTLFVVEHDNMVIGTFQVTLIPGLVAHGMMRAKLESVHVRPEWRGRGIGGRMVRHAIAFAQSHGAGQVELTSNKKRLDAHRFYTQLGFSQSHEGFKLML